MIRLALLLAALGASTGDHQTVVLGEVVYLHAKDENNRLSERIRYEHRNVQFVVVRTQRVLAGSEAPSSFLLGVEMTGIDAPGSKLIAPEYRVLDSAAWRTGSRFILIAHTAQRWECHPPFLFSDTDDPASDSRTAPYLDEPLNAFRSLPVYCADGKDLFLLRP